MHGLFLPQLGSRYRAIRSGDANCSGVVRRLARSGRSLERPVVSTWWSTTLLRHGIVLLLGLLLPLLPTWACLATGDEPARGTLFWRNGDQLPGDLLSADATTILWQSTLFPAPFTLNTERLDRIQFREPSTRTSSSMPFRVLTVDYDVLYGDLVELTPQHVVLKSPRHGTVRIERSKVVVLQRANRSSAGTIGLGLLNDWRTLHRGREVSEWTRDGTGRIVTKVTGAELFRDLHLVGLSDLEISLSWEGKPGFVISFAGPEAVRLSRQVVKLETWDNDLVLQTLGANGDFEVIYSIPATAQSIDLRLQWNPASGQLRVFTLTGQLLGKMEGKEEGDDPLSGLYVQNKGLALALTRLRAVGGHDAPAGDRPAGSVCLQLDDASSATGNIESYDATKQLLTLSQTSGGSRRIELDHIDSIEMGNQPLDAAPPTGMKISFVDGTLISGSVKSADDGVIHVQTAYASEPVLARLDGVSDIHFQGTAPEPDNDMHDVATIGGYRLLGQLTSVAGAKEAIGWLPSGSANASPLAMDQPVRIVRGAAETSTDAPANEFVDRIFLRNGDAVPCLIHGIDESWVHADFPLTDTSRIDRNLLLAVEFGAFAHAVSQGLADPRWVTTDVAKDAIERNDDQIVVKNAATIDYANMRDASEIKFDIEWDLSATTMIQVHLFADDELEMGGSPTLMLYRTGGTRVFLQVMQGGVGNARPMNPRELHDGRNTIRIRMRGKKVHLFEGDTELVALPRDQFASGGKKMRLYITPLNVNGGMAAPAETNKKLVTISNVEVRRSGGDLLEVLIDEDKKNRLLTVPRFRKQSPPTEILVGRNGDLLRGRLTALDERQATFQSRLDQLEVARDRLCGIIWPQAVDATSADTATDNQLARVVFSDGTIVRMAADRIKDGALLGQHPALGAIAVPLTLIRELSRGLDGNDDPPSPFASWTLRRAEEPKFATGSSAAGGSEGSTSQGYDSPLVGSAAPAFTAEMLDDTRVRVPNDSGKVVVLDFWASWCGPCVKTMPQTLQTVSDFPSEKVVLLAVNQLETPDAIHDFLQARGWEMPVALDRSGDIGKLYQVDSIPQLVVIGPAGKVARVFVGDHPETPQQLKALLAQLITEPVEDGSKNKD